MGKKGEPPATRSPSEKKALSYAKDRRNAFRENDKASRKAIPARKAGESRRIRHEAKQLVVAIPVLDPAIADVVESTVTKELSRKGGWRKMPDQPLGEHIERQQKRAEGRTMGKVTRRARREESPT